MKTELMKKIEDSRTIEKENYLNNISSFNDLNNLEVEDLRTINNLIEAYKENKIALEKAEKIKDKYSLYSKIYFNDSDDEIEMLLKGMDLDDEANFIYHLQNEFDVILKNKSTKERLKTIDEIKDLFKDVFTLTDEDFQPAMTRLQITDNWEKSLRTYSISEISHKLKYCFSKEELKELTTLHKETTKKIVKKRIEDLLTNCNFHSESGILVNGNYNKILDK
mgnify:FL=1